MRRRTGNGEEGSKRACVIIRCERRLSIRLRLREISEALGQPQEDAVEKRADEGRSRQGGKKGGRDKCSECNKGSRRTRRAGNEKKRNRGEEKRVGCNSASGSPKLISRGARNARRETFAGMRDARRSFRAMTIPYTRLHDFTIILSRRN